MARPAPSTDRDIAVALLACILDRSATDADLVSIGREAIALGRDSAGSIGDIGDVYHALTEAGVSEGAPPALDPDEDQRMLSLARRIQMLGEHHRLLRDQLATVGARLDEYDRERAEIAAICSEQAIPAAEPYPDEPGLSDWERSLRAGGRVVPLPVRVRRLADGRDRDNEAANAAHGDLRTVRQILGAAMLVSPESASTLTLTERAAHLAAEGRSARDGLQLWERKLAEGYQPTDEDRLAHLGAAPAHAAQGLDLLAAVDRVLVRWMGGVKEARREQAAHAKTLEDYGALVRGHQETAVELAEKLNAADRALDALGVARPESYRGEVEQRIRLLCEMRQRVARPETVGVRVEVDTSSLDGLRAYLTELREAVAELGHALAAVGATAPNERGA